MFETFLIALAAFFAGSTVICLAYYFFEIRGEPSYEPDTDLMTGKYMDDVPDSVKKAWEAIK